MAKWYVDDFAGNDANNGTSWLLAKKTIQAAQAVATGATDEIYVLSGTYNTGNITCVAATNQSNRHYAVGTVIIDGTGYNQVIADSYTSYWFGFVFRNADVDLVRNTSRLAFFRDCTFYASGAKYQVCKLGGNNNGVNSQNHKGCTIWGLDLAAPAASFIPNLVVNQCIIKNCVNQAAGNFTVAGSDWNATSSNTGTVPPRGANGWDTAAFPPPFVSEDMTTPDLRFNGLDAQYGKYMGNTPTTGGLRGRRVGGYGEAGSIRFSTDDTITYLASGTAWGTWINDESYYSTTLKTFTIDATNDKMNFQETLGGPEFTATIAHATYATGALYAAAIKTALDAAPGSVGVYTVTYSATTNRLNISTSLAYFKMLTLTGSNVATSAWVLSGYVITSDHDGATSYDADHSLCLGPQPGAEANATAAIFDAVGFYMEPDTGREPTGTNCRGLSDVLDVKRPQKLKAITIGKVIAGNGDIDNSQASTTRHLEVRGSNVAFTRTDAAGTTQLDWTMVEIAASLSTVITQELRYWQVRAMPRLNRTV